MRISACILALCLLCLTGCNPSPPPQNGTKSEPETTGSSFTARVIGVVDGDTVDVLDSDRRQRRIRLANIDAPERGQPGSAQSKRALSDMVFGREVTVQLTDRDRYQRDIGQLTIGGSNISRRMIEQGDAWAYRKYLTDQSLIAVEATARERRAGLWASSKDPAVAPWLWRDGVRSTTAEVTPFASTSPVRAPTRTPGLTPAVCGTKRLCPQMSTCEEATFFLNQCGVKSLDRDRDGVPCETICEP